MPVRLNAVERTSIPIDPVGSQGQPAATLEALQAAFKGMELKRAEVIMVTDWQDSRRDARYAVMVRDGSRALLSHDAFGPRYGTPGEEALRSLVRGLLDRGAVNFKERVLAPHEFNRLLDEPSARVVQNLNAAGNPADPGIYLE
jgi:hypothetical protein